MSVWSAGKGQVEVKLAVRPIAQAMWLGGLIRMRPPSGMRFETDTIEGRLRVTAVGVVDAEAWDRAYHRVRLETRGRPALVRPGTQERVPPEVRAISGERQPEVSLVTAPPLGG